MDKLTTEQKAKRYDEVIEKLRSLHDDYDTVSTLIDIKEELENILPELKESEGERIKRELCKVIWTYIPNEEAHEYIAWLEKQGKKEQDVRYKNIEELLAADDIYQMAMNDTMVEEARTKAIEAISKIGISQLLGIEKQGEQKPANNIVETWKDMRLEVYQQASGNRHEPNYSDDNTKMFSLNDIDEIIEKMSEQKSSDKVEPKFNVGDLIKDCNYKGDPIYEIQGIDSKCYICQYIGKENLGDRAVMHFSLNNPYLNLVEQKPSDKFKPKFQKGQWIVWQNKCYKVNDNGCGYELIDQNGLNTSLEYGTIDESAHLWSIADANAGDVLFHSDSASNGIFIFKEIVQCESIQEVVCYCDYDSEDGFCLGEKHTCCWANSKILHPASKEKCDLLFQKMKEGNYKWDAERKELKKIDNEINPFWC